MDTVMHPGIPYMAGKFLTNLVSAPRSEWMSEWVSWNAGIVPSYRALILSQIIYYLTTIHKNYLASFNCRLLWWRWRTFVSRIVTYIFLYTHIYIYKAYENPCTMSLLYSNKQSDVSRDRMNCVRWAPKMHCAQTIVYQH